MRTCFGALAQRLFGMVCVLSVASIAHAQATRTWVSGVGDDANPCSRTAPCKTWAGAISKTAVGGFIDALDPGGFGVVTITKSITLDGDATHAGILAAGSNAINVAGAGIVVTLRHLSLESPIGNQSTPGVNGINVTQAAEVHIVDCFIEGFSNEAIHFAPTGGGEGYISDTTMINNTGGGLVVSSGRVAVDNLHSESNGNGIMVNGNAIVTARNSFAAGGGAGFGAVTALAVLTIDNCMTTHNQYGIFVYQGAVVRASNTIIIDNVTYGISNDGISYVLSLQGNMLLANPNPGAFSQTYTKQ